MESKGFRVIVTAAAIFSLSQIAAFGQDAKSDVVDSVVSTPKGGHSRAGPAQCEDGTASDYTCLNVHLVSLMSLDELGAVGGIGLNDAWGWNDDDTGRRYALVAREDGMAFVDLTDPETPVYVGELIRPITAQTNVWRDIKVDGYYAFIVADGGSSRRGPHGMQVFDLRHLRSYSGTPLTFIADALYSEFTVAHNIAINEDSHRAYIVGARGPGEGCGGGLHIVDISSPLAPRFEGCFNDGQTGRGTGYTHDVQCVVYDGPDLTYSGREICIGSNVDALSFADVTDASNPIIISRGTYPTSSYVHQGWLTEDHRYFIQDDEGDERIYFFGGTRTFIWDVQDLDDPVLLTEFVSEVNAIDHNLYVRGDFAYQANYTSGLRILDISIPETPITAGWFDTLPDRDDISFAGAWMAYPYPDSDLIIVTSRDEGLFVLKPSTILGTRFGSVLATAGDASIRVSWEAVVEINVMRYRVERLLLDGSYEVLQEIPMTTGGLSGSSYEIDIVVEEGVHRVRVSAMGMDGGIIFSEDIVVAVIAGTHILKAPYPNPVSESLTSSLIVSTGQSIRISVFDAAGREVVTLFDGYLDTEREYPFSLDASSLAGGVYFLHIVGDNFSDSRKFVLAR